MVNSISPRSLWSLSHLDKNKLPESFPHLDLILCWKMSIWALVREVSNGLFIQDHHRHRTQHPRSNARHLRTARSLSLEIKQPLSHWKIREDPWNIEKTLHNILKTYNEKHETSNFESKCSFMTIYVFDVFDSFGPYKNTEHEGDRRNSHGFVGCNTPIIPEPPTKVTATQALSPGIVLSSSDRRRRKKKNRCPKSAEEIHFATAYGWPWLAHHHHHRIPYSLENPENVFPIVASCIFGHCTMRRDESRKAY